MDSSPRSRFERERRQGLTLTERDAALLTSLFLHRLLRRDQVEALFFTSRVRASARLRLLFDHGYVGRSFDPEAPYGAQAVYSVTPRAAPIVAGRLDLPEAWVRQQIRASRTPRFIAHTLGVADFALALRGDCRRSGSRLLAWEPEALCLHAYEIRPKGGGPWRTEVFRPDARFRIPCGAALIDGFLELDLGHTGARQILDKVAGFLTFVRSGVYATAYGPGSTATTPARMAAGIGLVGDRDGDAMGHLPDEAVEGAPEEAPEQAPVPILAVVTTGERRLQHLAGLARRLPEAAVCMATAGEIAALGPLSPAWRRPDGTRTDLAGATARGPPGPPGGPETIEQLALAVRAGTQRKGHGNEQRFWLSRPDRRGRGERREVQRHGEPGRRLYPATEAPDVVPEGGR